MALFKHAYFYGGNLFELTPFNLLGGLVPPLFVAGRVSKKESYRNSNFQNYGIIDFWRNDWVTG